MCRNHIRSGAFMFIFFFTLLQCTSNSDKEDREREYMNSVCIWNEIKLCDDIKKIYIEVINMDKINPKKPQRSNNSNDPNDHQSDWKTRA